MSKYLYILLVAICLLSCRENYVPKKSGYFRIDFPKEKQYIQFNKTTCPYTFEYPSYGIIQNDLSNVIEEQQHPCWFNIIIPEYRAKIYLSYTAIGGSNTIDQLVKDTYKLTFKHDVRADYIDETVVKGKHPNVRGVIFDVGGNAASGVQFFVTDELRHFLRGSLYFYSSPNADSLQPCIDYFRNDIVHIIETIAWN